MKSLKECADEIDLGTQYHLTRYAFLFESIVMSDGSTLIPAGEDGTSFSARTGARIRHPLICLAGLGLKGLMEMIDNRSDFKVFMQNYAYAHGNAQRGPRRDGPREEGLVGVFQNRGGRRHVLKPRSRLCRRLRYYQATMERITARLHPRTALFTGLHLESILLNRWCGIIVKCRLSCPSAARRSRRTVCNRKVSIG